MITIQGFAKLCGCSAQTLRYYDRIDLLKPAKVDAWTGYRYYEEGQALLFVKIKNLQQADFTIEEIKALLPEEDDLLMAAFEGKIREQERKLERIREIQRSYLQEKMDMQNMISSLIDLVEGRMNHPDLWQEFGPDINQDMDTSARIREKLADWLAQCRNASVEIAKQISTQDPDKVKEITNLLANGNPDGKALVFAIANEDGTPEEEVPSGAQKVFEISGWKHVSEWIRDIPSPDHSKKCFFLFSVREDSPVIDPGFPTFLLAVMDVLYDTAKGGMNCRTCLSGDGLNHFTLLQA